MYIFIKVVIKRQNQQNGKQPFYYSIKQFPINVFNYLCFVLQRVEISEFDKYEDGDITIDVEKIYNNFKDKPKIELRLEDSRMENYNYLDLNILFLIPS